MTTKFRVTIVTVLVILVSSLGIIPVHNVHGQDTANPDMAEFFTGLLERTNSDTEFSFRVSLMTPIFEGQVDAWIGLEHDTHISEIGSSYVCFTKMFSQSSSTQCIPFHNIGAVMFED